MQIPFVNLDYNVDDFERNVITEICIKKERKPNFNMDTRKVADLYDFRYLLLFVKTKVLGYLSEAQKSLSIWELRNPPFELYAIVLF